MKKENYILGIESSCDETSAAVVSISGASGEESFSIRSNVISSQIDIHKKYGGIVPEVAARSHIKNIIPVIDEALSLSGIGYGEISRIAVTQGPGLISSLMVGIEAAKALSYIWSTPLVPVNHILGHIYSGLLADNNTAESIRFPALVLVVSGGHTELIVMKSMIDFKKIGQTLDDAAGEAFDKVAKILGLGFPGGPIISALAEKGNPNAYVFPRPMMKKKNFHFSFSGLKTAVLYETKKSKNRNKKYVQDIAASFQIAVADVLKEKTQRAIKAYSAKTLIVGGGVSANTMLRSAMQDAAKKNSVSLIIPPIALCTDNAAPIAVAGYYGKIAKSYGISAEPNAEIGI